MIGTFWMLFMFCLSVSFVGAGCLLLCEWVENDEEGSWTR